MADDLDVGGLARELHHTREWTQRHWRRLVRESGLPAPFVGAERGAQPWWNGDAVARWKAGEAAPQDALAPRQGAGRIAQPTSGPANDAAPPPLGDRAEQLLASLG